jgi:hypothetical protein
MRTGLLTAVALAAVAFSGVAQASVITETFTALITGGTDNAGAFGAADASLAGDTVTFSFSYDAALLAADIEGDQEVIGSEFYDGTFTESATINSQTFTLTGSGWLQGCTAAGCGGDGSFATVADDSDGLIYQSLQTTQNYSIGDALSQTEVDALFGGGATTGVLQVGPGDWHDGGIDLLTIGNVNAESLSGTPEPTTWISLALGFGIVGLLKRRRSAR